MEAGEQTRYLWDLATPKPVTLKENLTQFLQNRHAYRCWQGWTDCVDYQSSLQDDGFIFLKMLREIKPEHRIVKSLVNFQSPRYVTAPSLVLSAWRGLLLTDALCQSRCGVWTELLAPAIRLPPGEPFSEEIEIDSVKTLNFFFKILPLLILQLCLWARNWCT